MLNLEAADFTRDEVKKAYRNYLKSTIRKLGNNFSLETRFFSGLIYVLHAAKCRKLIINPAFLITCFLYQSGHKIALTYGILTFLTQSSERMFSTVQSYYRYPCCRFPVRILTFLLRKEMSDNMAGLPDVPLFFTSMIIQSSEGNLSTKCGTSAVR